MADDAGPKQRGRPFKPGQSGDPRGKPPGVRHAALLALDAIGAEGAVDVMRAVVEAARNGDMRAADILLRRLWPERKGRPVRLDLPAVETPGDTAAVLGSITGAVAAGDLSPEEGAAMVAILETQRWAVETRRNEEAVDQHVAERERNTGKGARRAAKRFRGPTAARPPAVPA